VSINRKLWEEKETFIRGSKGDIGKEILVEVKAENF